MVGIFTWPLWTNTALAVAEMHGLIGAGYRSEMIERLRQSNWAEYVKTGGEYEKRIVTDPAKERHAWNVYVLRQHQGVDNFLHKSWGVKPMDMLRDLAGSKGFMGW